MNRLCVEQEVKQDAMELEPVLSTLSTLLDVTATASKEIVQVPMAPFCSVYLARVKYIELEHSMWIG